MSEQQTVQVVQQAYAAFQRGDIDGVIALLAEDIDWLVPGWPADLPMGGQRKGKAEVKRFFREVAESWNFEGFEPRQLVAQGETVVALGYYSGTSKAGARRFGAEWAHAFTIRNGKIGKFREYTDTANLLEALKPGTVRA
jgi:hypothetical protein